MTSNPDRNPERRPLKRKLADAYSNSSSEELSPQLEIKRLIEAIKVGARNAVEKIDRLQLRRAAHQLAEFCKNDELVETIVREGAVDCVVPLLSLTADNQESSRGHEEVSTSRVPNLEDIEKEACFILGLLAVKPEFQTLIARSGALSGLVKLIGIHKLTSMTKSQPGSGGVARRAADAITNLAHENVEIKHLVRQEGGIPPLVALLDAWDIKVQRAAAGALRTLAFKNEENKQQIVECGALPILIQMLRSEDVGVHYEAVGVIGNLVHSSQNIKRRVLEEGALQAVINLLSSTCAESQREAALLLGQFATTSDGEYKSKIVQRGAVPPLIKMLATNDTALKEMAAFALGRLAQNADNQAGIVQAGGLVPLLELLDSKQPSLQHNAAFALYGLAENEDNIREIIREGGLQQLYESNEKLQMQQSKDCVNKTTTRIKTKLETSRVLNNVVYLLRSSDEAVRQRVATSLAKLAPDGELKSIFVDKQGMTVLSNMLTAQQPVDVQAQQLAAEALLALAKRVNATAPIECGPQQPAKSVYLGEQYVNNPTLADVKFVVEGKEFFAHKIALLASSETFRAMFDSGYREREASSVEIPNIRYPVFEAMMRYVYTGQSDVHPEIARDLLQASDQYLLEGLKRLCEMSIADSLTVENLVEIYSLSEAFTAPQLGKQCVLFALEHYDAVVKSTNHVFYAQIMERMVPILKRSIMQELENSCMKKEEGTG